MTKTRRHHNNYGKETIRRGRTYDQIKRIAEKLNIPTKRIELLDNIEEEDK